MSDEYQRKYRKGRLLFTYRMGDGFKPNPDVDIPAVLDEMVESNPVNVQSWANLIHAVTRTREPAREKR